MDTSTGTDDWAIFPDDGTRADCDSTLIAEGISIACMLPPDHAGHPHEAGHDDHVYRWDDPDGSYQIAGILGTPYENEDWRTVHRA